MKKFLFFVFLAFVMSSCTKSDDIDPNCVEDLNPNCICIEIYEPVCGCNEVTYSNSCHAECAGILNYTPGPCQ
ncbi:MAG: Kazal-type serine protease inhibitor domain-containing protein [Bacteroidota bacterium]